MAEFNVLVGVVEIVEAKDEQDAIRILSQRLRQAGFETYEDGTSQLPHAFESEPA